MKEENDEKNLKSSETHRDFAQKSDKSLIKTSKSAILENNEILYEEVKERWYNLVAFCFCLIANGVQWLSFILISNQFSLYYSIPLWKIKIFSMIYFIVYPFVCIPEAWLFENYSIKIGYMLSAGCSICGSFLKIFLKNDKSLSVCYIGQIISCLFRPLLLNSPGKIAANWFKEDKRTLITSIICLSDTLGILIGYLWNLVYVKENAKEEEFKEQMFRYMLCQFLLVLFLCLLAFFIDKDEPDKLSSISQKRNKSLLLQDLKALFKNKNYIFLLIPNFFIVGYYFIQGNVFNNYLYIYKITKTQSIIIYSVSIIVGIISSIIISIFVDKTKKFKLFMIILSSSALIIQVFLTFLIEIVKSSGLNVFALCIIFYILINAVVIPFYCLVMNYACEITYPVRESYNGAILMFLSQLCGIGGTYLFDHFIDNNSDKRWIVNLILIIFFIISFIFILLSEEKLLRYNIDKLEIKEEKDKKKDDIQQKTIEVEIKQRNN